MNILELRTEKERTLFTISLVVSCLFWAVLILGTLGLGLIYIAAGAGTFLIVQAMFLAALKSNGVRITKAQLPELYARIEKAAERLQMNTVPEAYLLNTRGLFNAFATRFWGRDFIVLYAELLEACDEQDGSIDFIIGHELGHVALQHLKLAPVLLPSKLVPLLGAAYSRAREYSCDRAGTVASQHPDGAMRGLAVLAAGRRYSKRVNVLQYLEQRHDSAGFWAGVVELGMSHPYLPKRMGAILADTKPELNVPVVQRNIFSYFVAPFFAGSGAGAGVMAMVFIVGIGAAVAIPSVLRAKSNNAEMLMRIDEMNKKHDAAMGEVKPMGDEDPAVQEAAAKLQKQIEESMREAQRQGDVEAAHIQRNVDAQAGQVQAGFDVPSSQRKAVGAKKAKKVSTKKASKRRALPPPQPGDDEIY